MTGLDFPYGKFFSAGIWLESRAKGFNGCLDSKLNEFGNDLGRRCRMSLILKDEQYLENWE